MMMPMMMNTPSIPTPIYFKLSIKFIGSNIFLPLFYQRKKPSTSEPAMTDAICPETLTPMECMSRKF